MYIFLIFFIKTQRSTIRYMTKIKKGIYRHFKGNLYEVLSVVRHSETTKEMVLYKALYVSPEFGENTLWVRPINMFEEEVVKDGKKMKRFTYIGTKKSSK